MKSLPAHGNIGTMLLLICLGGCSIERLAVDSLGSVLEATSVAFASDNDPQFVAEALPFSLKLIDGILLEQPEHRDLLIAAASGYVSYGYAFISVPAERLSLEDIDAAREERDRAGNLFLRAHGYAIRALELDYPDIGAMLENDPEAAVARLGADGAADVEPMYWTAAALGLAISSSRNEPALLARLPEVEALLDRALALDPDWNGGSLHELAISMAGVRGTDAATLRSHYEQAIELSSGMRAGVYVAYAEATAIPAQDRAAFVALLDRALAVDLDAAPGQRLANVIAQRRAEEYIARLDEFFLE